MLQTESCPRQNEADGCSGEVGADGGGLYPLYLFSGLLCLGLVLVLIRLGWQYANKIAMTLWIATSS